MRLTTAQRKYGRVVMRSGPSRYFVERDKYTDRLTLYVTESTAPYHMSFDNMGCLLAHIQRYEINTQNGWTSLANEYKGK